MKNTPTETLYQNIDFALKLHNQDMMVNNMGVVNNKTAVDKNVNDYYLNNFEFRDTRDWEVGKPSEIVALGCSHTYGVGVPQKYTWPSIVESKTEKTVSNLGICGASAEKTLNAFMFYLEKVGKPKYVLACFPDHLRYSHIVEGKFYPVNGDYNDKTRSRKIVSHLRTSDYLTGEINMKDSIVKFPADPRHVIPPQESLSQYISSIYIIEKFCSLLNIKFYWGTWSTATQTIFTENLFLQENFCLDSNNHVKTIKSNITANEFLEHAEYSPQLKCTSTHDMKTEDLDQYENMWRIGSDGSHLGIHWQYHTAESFIKIL